MDEHTFDVEVLLVSFDFVFVVVADPDDEICWRRPAQYEDKYYDKITSNLIYQHVKGSRAFVLQKTSIFKKMFVDTEW